MREPKAESGLHNFGPGNTETCFSWPWTRPKFSIQLLFQVWSMQRLVSVFHIMSVRWCVAFTSVGTSRHDMEASLLASTFPKVVLYPLFCFRLFWHCSLNMRMPPGFQGRT